MSNDKTKTLTSTKPAGAGSIQIQQLFKVMVDNGASDLHITVGSAPGMRISGEIARVKIPPLNADDTKRLVYQILTEAQRSELEKNLRKKAEEIERKESLSTETLRMQMSIVEKKEKELANREAEIEKERIYSEKMLQQEAEALEQREMELIRERKNILRSKIDQNESFAKESSLIDIKKSEVETGIKKIEEERAEIETRTSVIEETNVPSATTHIFKEDNSPQWPAGLDIQRDRSKLFQHFKYEFISIVLVNLSRCTSDKAVDFKTFLNKVFESNSKKVILDVSYSEFLDSTFLGVMVAFLKQLRRNDREMKIIVELSKMTTTTFILSGLDRVFTLEEDLKAAFFDFYNE